MDRFRIWIALAFRSTGPIVGAMALLGLPIPRDSAVIIGILLLTEEVFLIQSISNAVLSGGAACAAAQETSEEQQGSPPIP